MPAMPTDLVAWCEALEVTQGDHEGELLTLLDWERDFLRSVEASAGGELGLSVPAGAGKTTLCAAVAAAGGAGPLAKRVSEGARLPAAPRRRRHYVA